MTTETGLALAAMVCFGFSDYLYRRAAAAGFKAHHFIMAQAWLFCPTVLAYAAATGTLSVSGPARWGSLAGLFIYLGFYLFAVSLRSGSISINAPIFRLSFVITAALAIGLLGEPLTVGKCVGLALGPAAAWLLLGGAAGESPARLSRSIGTVVLASIAAGIGNFCHKLGIAGGALPSTLLAAQAMVFCSLATVITFARESSLRLPPRLWVYAVPTAVAVVAAFLMFLHALGRGDASVVVPITQMGFVPAALLGIAAGGEPLSLRKAIGITAAVVALAALAWT